MGQGASNVSCALVPNIDTGGGGGEEEGEEDKDRIQDEQKGDLMCSHLQLQMHNANGDFVVWLPDECLAYVFQKLGTKDRNQCSLVCKRWYHVEAQCRQRISLHARAEIVSILPSIFVRFEHITKLALRGDRKSIGMDDKALLLIAQHCTNLCKLKIKSCRQLTDEGIGLFSRVVSSTLRKLSCSLCSFGAHGMNSIVYNCSLLEDLSVKRLKGLIEGPAEFIGPGSCNIRRLCLKELFNAQLFGPLIAGSKDLHTLIVCRNSGNWDSLLTIISEQVSNLVEVHVEKLHLSDRGLQAISRWTQLEVLYLIKLSECSNVGLSAIAEGCKRLRKLHIDGSKINRIGDDGLVTLATKCRELQEIVLISINATAVSLGLLASNCPALERLALCNSDTVGDTELYCITSKCYSLKKLCLKNCDISDEGMKGLAVGCPKLMKVKIKKCKRVTYEIVNWLQAHRPSLLVSLDCELPHMQIAEAVNLVEGVLEVPFAAVPRSPRPRSPLTKLKLALAASGSFVACSILRRHHHNE